MGKQMLRCPYCGSVPPPGATYCLMCGEAVDPALVAELQWLYGALNDLDTRVARGEGDQTITTLRDKYRDRYLTARRAPAPAAATPARASVAQSPGPAASAASVASSASSASSATPASGPQPTPQSTPQSTPKPATPTIPSTPAQPRPEGPVFSWQAFLSEQAIAIMMYMGGFLGLVAMLSFEIGGWQSLDLRVKLGAIIVVYLAFGALGLLMRRRPRLRTVGGSYLGVFALMTPLLALGIYRFGLQAAGFSGAAMLCLSSAYAAIVYLALAWRTQFVTYAYLGWSALVLAALSAVFWALAPGEAVIFALAFVSVLLLLPSLFRLFSFADLLETPALQLAAVTSLAAAGGTLFLGLALATRAIDETPLAVSATPPPHYSTAVLALAACTLVLVAGAWSYLARGLTRGQEEEARAGRLNVVDWLVVAAVTQAVIALAAWAGADRRAMAVVLSILALAEAGTLFTLWRRARERTELRYLVEALALGLAIFACLGVASDPAPNWPYLLALTSGLVVTGGLAVFEAAPLWLLPAGVFLSLDYYTLLDTLFHQALAWVSVAASIPVQAVAATLLVIALVVPWLVVGQSRLARRFAAPVYVIALGNALYGARNLVHQDAFYATLILGLFVVLALVAGWRSRYPLVAGLAAGFFGFFLPLPLSVAGGEPRFVLGAAVAAVVVGLLALGVRALLGRASALPAYLVALWMA
ncbi:MAG TPA: zinc ribbon domain-containing protein, partial [Ktedonobacterales bacterium]|nr:zinc ribbon domain-containing protein [Ktedonobacterales bacterium]